MKVTIDTTPEEILEFIQKAMDKLKAESSTNETASKGNDKIDHSDLLLAEKVKKINQLLDDSNHS